MKTGIVLVTLLAIAPPLFVRSVVGFDQPPVVTVWCPESVVAGDKLICTATTSGRPRYEWRVTAGRITEGQGTARVTIDTTGLGDQKIKISVERRYRRDPIAWSTTQVLISRARHN